MNHSTYPITLREAALALEWGDTRNAEDRLRRYIKRRVQDGAPDPTYHVGRLVYTTMRRIYAALPELNPSINDPFALHRSEHISPNRLMTVFREVAEEIYEEHDLDRIRKII